MGLIKYWRWCSHHSSGSNDLLRVHLLVVALVIKVTRVGVIAADIVSEAAATLTSEFVKN